jgi:DNA-binding NarL/FixJ family response regulator
VAAALIRVAIVDDHPAVRLGLRAALAAEPGFVPVGAAASATEVAPLLYRTDPDVVLLDYQLPDADGLTLCREIKLAVPARRVILYSAFADASMTVPAIVAGADGIVHKGVRPQELFEAIRAVAAGRAALPHVHPVLLEEAGIQLDADDLPILAMLVDRTPASEIAATLGIGDVELARRVRRMLDRLKLPVPRSEWGAPPIARRS